MKKWLWLACVLGALAACDDHRADNSSDAGRDAGHDAGHHTSIPDAGHKDADVDASTYEAACKRAAVAYDTFLSEHRACSVDADCAVIGDCGPNADFAAVRADGAAQARKLQRARCPVAYDGPEFGASCVANVCKLHQLFGPNDGCPPPWDGDGGSEDAGR